MTGKAYSDGFYADLDDTAAPSARVVVPLLTTRMPVTSVVDLGCGDGGWLQVFREHGATKVLGVDGPWVSEDRLKIPADCFVRQPLDRQVAVDGRFDLAMSVEVAEHLPPERAASFVGELCGLAPVVLFSAALPGQGGLHHVNEQWPAYWAELFAGRGYRCLDVLRAAIWNEPQVTWWYKQNLLLFAAPEAIAAHPGLQQWADEAPAAPRDLVHPEVLRQALRAANPGIGKWLRSGGRALRRSLSKRMG
jgi:SAM-dependent methyltransferase